MLIPLSYYPEHQHWTILHNRISQYLQMGSSVWLKLKKCSANRKKKLLVCRYAKSSLYPGDLISR